MMRALAFFALMSIAASSVVVAADFAIPPVPNHYVTDNASALSGGTYDALESRLHAYEAATHHQLIVWIGQTTGDVPLEAWTGETASHWKVGRKGHDDGAVLFLFMHDHKVRIEVGYGLEGALTDADASRIIRDDIVPKMRSGDVDGAVSSGVAAMITTITPTYAGVTPPPAAASSAPLNPGALLAILVVVLSALTVIMVFVRLAAGRGRRGHVITSGHSGAAAGGFSSGSSSSDDDSGGGDDFSSGGGDFGGGGASGSW